MTENASKKNPETTGNKVKKYKLEQYLEDLKETYEFKKTAALNDLYVHASLLVHALNLRGFDEDKDEDKRIIVCINDLKKCFKDWMER